MLTVVYNRPPIPRILSSVHNASAPHSSALTRSAPALLKRLRHPATAAAAAAAGRAVVADRAGQTVRDGAPPGLPAAIRIVGWARWRQLELHAGAAAWALLPRVLRLRGRGATDVVRRGVARVLVGEALVEVPFGRARGLRLAGPGLDVVGVAACVRVGADGAVVLDLALLVLVAVDGGARARAAQGRRGGGAWDVAVASGAGAGGGAGEDVLGLADVFPRRLLHLRGREGRLG